MAGSFYEILGVQPDAEDVVIRAAYRALMLRYHPDTNHDSGAEAKAKRITEAFETLSDPSRRASYDAGLRSAKVMSQAPPPRPPPQAPPRSPEAVPVPPSSKRIGKWGWAFLGGLLIVLAIEYSGFAKHLPAGVASSADAASSNEASAVAASSVAEAPRGDPEEAFKAYLQSSLGEEAHKYGGPNSKPDYKILYSGDLNGDGVEDFIIYNSTAGMCGSGGCSAEVYVGNKDSGFHEIEAPDLFGAGMVMVSGQHGRWKDIVKVEAASAGSFGAYHRLVYKPEKSSYTAAWTEFCGGLDYTACDKPLILCDIDAGGATVPADVDVFLAPPNEGLLPAGTLSQAAFAPREPPADEPNWISSETQDGNWLLVDYKFTGVRFVRTSDIQATLPPVRRCH